MDRHLGCFHILAIVMLKYTQGCMCLFKLMFLFSLGKYLVIELLDHIIILFLIFWEIIHTVFHSGYRSPIYSTWGFLFLYILVNTCHFLCFFNSLVMTSWTYKLEVCCKYLEILFLLLLLISNLIPLFRGHIVYDLIILNLLKFIS